MSSAKLIFQLQQTFLPLLRGVGDTRGVVRSLPHPPFQIITQKLFFWDFLFFSPNSAKPLFLQMGKYSQRGKVTFADDTAS